MSSRLNSILVLVLLVCALSIVASNHRARKLFIELEREQARMHSLDVEWGQLQLEQSTWANHARVEKIAPLETVSAREPRSPPDGFDVLQVVLVVSALVADAVALWAIAARITEFGFTPNRVAALGENVILLVNLTWSAVLYIRFLRGSGSFTSLEKWQTDYLPVYSAWAAIVVMLFPPVFGYR